MLWGIYYFPFDSPPDHYLMKKLPQDQSIEETSNIDFKLSNIEYLLVQIKKSLATTNNDDQILTLDELSSYTGLSKSCLYKFTANGTLPFYKPSGKVIFFRKSEIDSWILSKRSQGNEELEMKANTRLLLNKKNKWKA